jgi:uncharacterized membrane protein YdjX (TVP38/TMEM64 family)
MWNATKHLWPLALGFALFLLVSGLVQTHLGQMSGELKASSMEAGMTLFLLLGVGTVMVPFASILPFVPLAVALWGWPITALLTTLAWVLGSQILFEAARYLGKPVIMKFVSPERMEGMASMLHRQGLVNAVMIRMFVHGDITSYAFGIFSNITRWEFLLVTAVGVAPGALAYAYVGSLPFVYQVSLAGLGLCAIVAYSLVREKWPHALRLLEFRS